MKIIFYDGDCGFCQKAVLFICKCDKKKQFFFAPLSGETARKKIGSFLTQHQTIDSLVFVDHHYISYYSKAVFSIAWQLGGFWSFIGILSFLPEFLLWPFNIVYKIIAKQRRNLCLLPKESSTLVAYKDRFLS